MEDGAFSSSQHPPYQKKYLCAHALKNLIYHGLKPSYGHMTLFYQ